MEDTYPKLLLRNCHQWGDKAIALRKKRYGIWKEHTWKDCYDHVRGLFLGLVSLEIGKGERVAILADTNPEWFWAELAVQAAGGVVVGVNSGSSRDEIKHPLQESQSKCVLAQDQEQVDKLLEIKDHLPLVKKVIFWDDTGMRRYTDPLLTTWSDVVKAGEEYERTHPGYFDEAVRLGSGDDPAMLFFTAGANGTQRAVEASHRFLISAAESTQNSHPVGIRDNYVSVINPGWFFEQTLGFGACLLYGQILNFPENVDTAPMDSREISPHAVVFPSFVWDGIAQSAQTGISAGSWYKRGSFKKAMSSGYTELDMKLNGAQRNVLKRVLHRVGHFLARYSVYRPLKDKHGLNKARVAYSVGGSLSAETRRFYEALGVNLVQIYGSTEQGIVSEEPASEFRLE